MDTLQQRRFKPAEEFLGVTIQHPDINAPFRVKLPPLEGGGDKFISDR
jgi:hypothetical protein